MILVMVGVAGAKSVGDTGGDYPRLTNCIASLQHLQASDMGFFPGRRTPIRIFLIGLLPLIYRLE